MKQLSRRDVAGVDQRQISGWAKRLKVYDRLGPGANCRRPSLASLEPVELSMVSQTASEAASQQQVFSFLTDPATHGGRAVQRIDTHAASVFLAGDDAFKVKRAVRYPYLDFSTLEKRKAALEVELDVNRAFAPQIYIGVVPIMRRPGDKLALGGDGVPVEWALRMRRFDETQTLDHLAAAGLLDAGLAAATAEAIVASHDAAAICRVAAWPQSVPALIAGNTGAFVAAGCFAADQVQALDRDSGAAFARLSDLLAKRRDAGFVRRCHGDLHLANIVRIAGRPVLFDALEFDAAMATTDVLYDLAFVLMDLISYGRCAAANIMLNSYLAATSLDNLDALSMLPLFLSIRAAIRANVLLARLDRWGSDSADIKARAETYFRLAGRLIAPAKPRLIAVGGLSGTGKSVLARALAPDIAPMPGAVLLRSDVLRKRQFAMRETDCLPAEAYRPEVTAKIYATLAEHAGRVLAAGHSVVVDAVFARPSERAAIAAVARGVSVAFTGLFLEADTTIRAARVASRRNDASDATAEVARQQDGYDLGAMDWIPIDASGAPEQTLARSRATLSDDKRS
jgi:aminoglycoside phosphotransferase family enzyme/predicted kinase